MWETFSGLEGTGGGGVMKGWDDDGGGGDEIDWESRLLGGRGVVLM